MSGKRLLDAAALFNASRAVASQHLSIRLRQLDVYSKTSTLAKALKKQTDSSALRSSPSADGASSQQTYSSKSGSTAAERIPSLESVQGRNDANKGTEGLEQDHHYRPQDDSVLDDVPNEEEEAPSGEMVNQIFHSPRVARILGSKGQLRSLKPNNAGSPRRKSTVAGQRKDRNNLHARIGAESVAPSISGGESKPAPWAKREKDNIIKIAADIKKDARAPSKVSKTPMPFCAVLIN